MSLEKNVEELFHQTFTDLVFDAHEVHRKNFKSSQIQKSQLLSIKTGGCPEDCSYCPQSAHYNTGVEKSKLMKVDQILTFAKRAKKNGATRLCMGAAWREVKEGEQFEQILEIVRQLKTVKIEICCTLGMLSYSQACRLKEAGLYAYNHNIDTSKNYYKKIISTRNYQQRLETIKNVRAAGLSVCTGGIIGLGESDVDRVEFIKTLTTIEPSPESITINTLVRSKGTPLEKLPGIDPITLVRTIATVRILFPKAMIRLSAGRDERSQMEQFICFYVGANSIFMGDKLLTSPNPNLSEDASLFQKLDLETYENHRLH